MQQQLHPELQEQVEARIGRIDNCQNLSWQDAEAQVYCLNEIWILKIFQHPRNYTLARSFYDHYQSQLPFIPHCKAAFEKPLYALLLNRLPGTLVLSQRFDRDTELSIYQQAGQHLAQIHQLPFNDLDPLPLGDAHIKRAHTWLQRATHYCQSEDIAWAETHIEALSALNDYVRVPCHRDFTARNWLWDKRRLYVIDFERSRPDWWLLDCERLFNGAWHQDDALRDAFFAGYGKRPSTPELALLQKYSAIAALATITWAHEHNDHAFKQEGLATLARLKQTLS